MRTDISEDPKGDPTKVIPNQPIPDRRAREGITPAIPPPEESAPEPADEKQTDADRRQLRERRE